MLIAPPPTTRGNSAGPAAKLFESCGQGPPFPRDPDPAAPLLGCKVVLLAPGWRVYKTHFGNKVPLPGALLRLKASGRKRTHPLASQHRRTRVPERKILAPLVPIRSGGPGWTLCFLEEGSIDLIPVDEKKLKANKRKSGHGKAARQRLGLRREALLTLTLPY